MHNNEEIAFQDKPVSLLFFSFFFLYVKLRFKTKLFYSLKNFLSRNNLHFHILIVIWKVVVSIMKSLDRMLYIPSYMFLDPSCTFSQNRQSAFPDTYQLLQASFSCNIKIFLLDFTQNSCIVASFSCNIIIVLLDFTQNSCILSFRKGLHRN